MNSYLNSDNFHSSLQLMEANILVRVRQNDVALTESIIEAIQDTYKDVSGKDTIIKVDKDNFLPADSCGGVELIAGRGM